MIFDFRAMSSPFPAKFPMRGRPPPRSTSSRETHAPSSEGARTVAVSTAAGDVRVFRGDELSWSTVESRGVVDVAILGCVRGVSSGRVFSQ